jgi:uncharacterized protein YecT (DUF1311 family)
MIKNLRAVNVVAFDRKGQPIITHPSNWIATLHGNTIVLKYKSNVLTYDLSRDCLYLGIANQDESTDIGKTLGRVALTGLAGSLIKKGSFLGAALLDLSVRGTDKRSICTVWLLLKDRTSLAFECIPEDFEKLKKLAPSSATSREGARKADQLIDLVERMVVDGERVLVEIEQETAQLEQALKKAKTDSETGAAFEIRNSARQEIDRLHSALDQQTELRRAVEFGIRYEEHVKKVGLPRVSSTYNPVIIWGGSAFILGFVVLAVSLGPTERTPPLQTDSSRSARSTQADISPIQTPPEQSKQSHQQEEQKEVAEEEQTATSPTPTASDWAPSFSCDKATKKAEIIICSSKDLSNADVEMANVYKKALAAGFMRERIISEQRDWIRSNRDVCEDESCLLSAYRERIQMLIRYSQMTRG